MKIPWLKVSVSVRQVKLKEGKTDEEIIYFLEEISP